MAMMRSKRLSSKRAITLPKDLCNHVGFDAGETIDITANDDGSVTIRKHVPVCRFCGDRLAAKTFKGVDVCPGCADERRKEVGTE